VERIRGYALLARRRPTKGREAVEVARTMYLGELGYVWPVDAAIGVMGGEIMVLLPHPRTPPRQAHKQVASALGAFA